MLICGGNLPAIANCEVVNLDSATTTCKSPPNFPETFWSAIGGLGFKENPIICGGLQKFSYVNKCYSLQNNEWASSFILREGSKEWQTGPELPFHIGYSQMVEDPNGGVVLIGGTTYSLDNLDTLYKLIHAGQDGAWTKMKQKLMTGRVWHTAFLIPDNIVDCS